MTRETSDSRGSGTGGGRPVGRRALGRSGVVVSELALGTVKLGRAWGVKYPSAFDLPTDAEAHALLDAAQELGVTTLDCAPAYGVAEERLGKLLAERSEHADAWQVCTKAGEGWEEDGAGGYRSVFDFSPGAVRASVERSLRRLGRETLDLVLIHSDGDDMNSVFASGAADELARLKERGMIRACGASTKTVGGGIAAAERTDAVMVTLNRAERDDLAVITRARETGAGVLIKKALGSGHHARDTEPALLLREALDVPGVSGVVVGTISPEHLRANARACD